MSRKTVFSIVAILSFLCGLMFLVFPKPAMAVYGINIDDNTAFITRYMGLWQLGIGVLFWLIRKTDSIKGAVRGCIIGGIVITVLGMIVSIWNIFSAGNPIIWLNVGLYGIPLILFIILFARKAE